MIVPEKMVKMRIAAPRSYSYTIINTLYRLNIFHVKDYEKGELDGLDAGEPLVQAEALSEALINIRAVKAAWGTEESVQAAEPRALTKKAFDDLNSNIKRLKEQTAKLLETIKTNEQQRDKFAKNAVIADALNSLGVDASLLPKIRFLVPFIGTIKDLGQLKSKAESLLGKHLLKTASVYGERLITLFVNKNDEFAARGILNEAGFSELDTQEYGKMTAAQFRKKRADAEKELSEAKHKLNELKRAEKNRLLENEFIFEEEIKKVELPLHFAITKKSFIAAGYIPEKSMHRVKEALQEVSAGNIMVEEEEPEHDEAVPIKLNNPRGIKNFEVLTRLYELPQYLEVDPSILMFLTFPLFFGFMLGDVGYGAVTLSLFLFLKKKMPEGKQLLNVLIYASIVTLLFGFMFGEYFGFEHVSEGTGEALCNNTGLCLHKEVIGEGAEEEVVYSFPRLMSRVESKVDAAGYEILTVLFIGAIVGFIHLNLGFLIGFYNLWRAHGIKHAVLEKLSWIIMEAGAILAVMSLTGVIGLHVLVGVLIFVGAVVMMYIGGGVKELIEIPALLSNTLSYMRLGAVGLASVGLAVVINEDLAMPFINKGGWYILVAIVIMILGHLINIGLGVLGPFLHSVRLHYVEFFSKFFHGGGREYRPFGYKKVTDGGE